MDIKKYILLIDAVIIFGSLLIVAGKRFSGTRAAIIAFLKHFKRIAAGNIHDSHTLANVVEGVDLDSDGIVDDVEFRE